MNQPRSFAFLLFLALLLLTATLGEASREAVLASREKRLNQLKYVVDQARKKVDDHHSGKKLLEKHKLDHLQHKVQAYEHQMEELGRELDEDEIQRKVERAARIRQERMHREL